MTFSGTHVRTVRTGSYAPADRKSENCMTVARMIAVEGNEKAMKLSRWKVYR